MGEWNRHTQASVMSEIVEVRYTDLEREKVLCEELLLWSQANRDRYAHAFALTYLADYAVAHNDQSHADSLLSEAHDLIANDEDRYAELTMRLHSLWGICRETLSDEQGCIEHYLKAATLARRLGDAIAECVVLNNMAFVFQHYSCYSESEKYYREAYRLQKETTPTAVFPYIVSNLAEVCVQQGKLEEARRLIEECEQVIGSPEDCIGQTARCWCGYYAAQGNREQALSWAKTILDRESTCTDEDLWAFDNYYTLFDCMMELGSKDFSQQFLSLMNRTQGDGSLEKRRRFEEARIKYVITFEDRETHLEAYRIFFAKLKEFASSSNEIIAGAMRTQIELEESLRRREELRLERESLEVEASVDELMGIYNRRYLNHLLMKRASVFVGGSLGIVMLDIDHFKEYNDRYGHLDGDEVLRAVGAVVRDFQTAQILPCRYGGDELVCVCDGVTVQQMEEYTAAVSERIAHLAIENQDSPYGVITLSIGYTWASEGQGIRPSALLQYADEALYEAKQKGRNAIAQKWVSARE